MFYNIVIMFFIFVCGPHTSLNEYKMNFSFKLKLRVTWRKSTQYPMNALEGLREGESIQNLRQSALEGMNEHLDLSLRTASGLEDWDSDGEAPFLVFERVLCKAPRQDPAKGV